MRMDNEKLLILSI